MRALTFRGRRTVRLETVPDPAIVEPGDAIVRVRRAGICGSDLHVYHERERGLDHGTVMGHEFVGEVLETGPGVRTLTRGMRIASPFTTNCAECFYCRQGLTARCERGALFGWVAGGRGLHGAQAEYVRVPLADSTLVPLPEEIDDDEALLLGDVLPTGFFCAELAGLGAGGVCVVLGCGPVGLMAVLGARERGVERIFAIDPVPERRELARRFGAEPLDPSSADVTAAVRETTAGRGADAVLEVVGTPRAGRLAFELVRPGGTIAAVGVHTEARMAFSPVEAYDKNLTFRAGRCPARHLMPELLELLRRRKYDLGAVVSHRMPLSEGPDGYGLFDEKRDGCTKVVLEI